MRKVAGWVSMIYLIFVSAAVAERPSHLEELRSRYPYGLIGDDYGLLTVEDLAVNACRAEELTPFVSEKNWAYPYWQCFPLKNAELKCDSSGYDSVAKMEMGYIIIAGRNENGLQSYIARDARDMRECKRYLLKWKKRTRGEKFVCIAGSFGRVHEAKGGRKETDWVFEKYKTRKGCVSDGFACRLKEATDCASPSARAESWFEK